MKEIFEKLHRIKNTDRCYVIAAVNSKVILFQPISVQFTKFRQWDNDIKYLSHRPDRIFVRKDNAFYEIVLSDLFHARRNYAPGKSGCTTWFKSARYHPPWR